MFLKTIYEGLNQAHLCTFFVLPLLKLNVLSFVETNFSNSYISPDGKLIAVKVKDISLVPTSVLHHSNYAGMWRENEVEYFTFCIPEKWWADVDLFMQGKFSEMSFEAKKLIDSYSALMNGHIVPKKKDPQTDFRLLALRRHKRLREIFEKELDMKIPESFELLPHPFPDCYKNIKVKKSKLN